VSCLIDDDIVSVGSGTGSLSWPIGNIPVTDTIDWTTVHDVPTVLITGSNGKTTSTRMLSAVLAQTGRVVGMCCTDSVTIGGIQIAAGDWAGPGGARMVLRDRRVEIAVLETARGGILRRGLAASHAQAAIVTNIAEDHFGEFGIHDLHALAEAKLVVTRALPADGVLVLNADDAILADMAPEHTVAICWFSLTETNPIVRRHSAAGGRAVWVERGEIRIAGFGGDASLGRVEEIPIAHHGSAGYNIANALGVAAAALSLGVAPEAVRQGLSRFRGSAADNPGRLNLFEFGDTRAIADFAHNPHGMEALVQMARSLPARRRLLMLGQAGDRDDNAIREFARSGWTFKPDRIVLKEMEKYRRGRAVGEVAGILRDEFIRLGADPAAISIEPSEFDAVIASLKWAQAGDLLLLPLHADRDRGLALLEELRRSGWRAGGDLAISY
jgi:cyanophycin synthetase